MSHIIKKDTIAQGKWLGLKQIYYCDNYNKERTWEAAERPFSQGAVGIIAHIMPNDEYIFVEQFRPPVGKNCLEFPAGLIDDGEVAEDSAIRELYEETGFHGQIKYVAQPSYSSAGMSSESITLVHIEIDGTLPENQNPKNHPEGEEDIVVHRVKTSEVAKFINNIRKEQKAIDSKIISFFFKELINYNK